MFAHLAKAPDGQPLAIPDALQALRDHAIRSFPNECIGYIDRNGSYCPMENISPEPTKTAIPDRRQFAQEVIRNNVRALCHSHTNGMDCPSQPDMEAQIELDVPFIIVLTNGQACRKPFAWGDCVIDETPLFGGAGEQARIFRHGVQDCYEFVRAWFWREQQIRLPQYPRNWNWWTEDAPGGKDLYSRFFAEAGFIEIDRSEVVEGDCWLSAMRSDVPNHAGVYLGNGLTAHHPSSGLPFDPSRLARRDAMTRWTPFVTHWLRRV